MAKIIKYKFLSCEVENKQIILDKELNCPTEADLEANLTIAQEEAYNGEYTIEDDGAPESADQTPEERIAELEDALELLLSGVTE